MDTHKASTGKVLLIDDCPGKRDINYKNIGNSNKNNTIKIYPKPFCQSLTIESPVFNTGDYALISDITGKTLNRAQLNGNNTFIDLSMHQNGVYLIAYINPMGTTKARTISDKKNSLYSIASVIINVVIFFTFLMLLPQCKKCHTTCEQSCVGAYRDTTLTTIDTLCSSNYNSFAEFMDTLRKRPTYYHISTNSFSGCGATASRLKGASCQ